MKFEYKKFSVPINYISTVRNDVLTETIKRHGRIARYQLSCPIMAFFYFKGGSMEEYYRARDKWKQGLVGHETAKEYRLFHKKMA
jgi:hypothetical protein